jgi:nitrogenase delta subunit
VDAVCLADAFKSRYPWVTAMDKREVKLLIEGLKGRIGFLTIKGSLNKELTDPRY